MKKVFCGLIGIIALLGVSTSAQAGTCSCSPAGQSYQLIYVDTEGNPNVLFTYNNSSECSDALTRTYLCNTDSPAAN